MKNLKYVAFLLSVSLVGFSPNMVYASDSGVVTEASTDEVKQSSIEVTTENDETNTSIEEVIKQPEILPNNQEPVTSDNQETATSNEQEITSPPQVVSGSSIEMTVPSDFEVEKKEVALDAIPEELHIDLPSAITLESLSGDKYGYNGVIKVYCDSDKEYRVDLVLKNTDIEYVSSDGYTASGVATIGDSNGYSWSYEDVASGLEVPISIIVDKPEYTGSYSTVLNFDIDIYEMQEVVSEEDTSEPKDNEEVVDKDTDVEDKENADTSKVEDKTTEDISEDTKVEDKTTEEVKEDTEVKDNSEADVSESEDVDSDDSSVSGVVIHAGDLENTDTINISHDVVSIDADAFDNLDLLETINYDGTIDEWNEIFSGSLKEGVVLNVIPSIADDEEEIPTESTATDEVEDSQLSDNDSSSSQDEVIKDSQSSTEVDSVESNSSLDNYEDVASAETTSEDTVSADTVSESIDE